MSRAQILNTLFFFPLSLSLEFWQSIDMGIIRKTLYTGVLTGASVVGYLGLTTTITCPLPSDDPLWRSKAYAQFNKHRNPSTQDIVTKTCLLYTSPSPRDS